ncbi:DUF3558 domain-containing protein [Rhodococcus sp. P1Y]|uniref:DUF3558 domain-containing protein n=1 Tax=Rhodococcus sp. P1Y TaxID=1302308 RepID=UPI001292FE1A|nr:DUF3558 domain-containing protein [Rhodococcus sp. P1Y]
MLSALVLASCAQGCSTDVAGNATTSVEAAGASSITEMVPAEAAGFDPCDLPTELLEDLNLSGVVPTSAGPSGCIWGNDRFALGVLLVEDTTMLPDPSSSPVVSRLETLSDGGYVTHLFVLDEDTYTTQTMTRDGAVVLNATVAGSDSMESERDSLVDTFRTVLPYFPAPE